MLTHAARMGAITALLILCALLPYLPGRHDVLAGSLSVAARVSGMTGLLLVPIGAAWLAYELWSRRGGNGAPQSRPGRRRFAIVALVVGSAVCLVASLGLEPGEEPEHAPQSSTPASAWMPAIGAPRTSAGAHVSPRSRLA